MTSPDDVESEEPTIRFTVREMLARIDGKLDTMATGHQDHETRIRTLEADKRSHKTTKEEWHMRFYIAGAYVGALASIITVIIH